MSGSESSYHRERLLPGIAGPSVESTSIVTLVALDLHADDHPRHCHSPLSLSTFGLVPHYTWV